MPSCFSSSLLLVRMQVAVKVPCWWRKGGIESWVLESKDLNEALSIYVPGRKQEEDLLKVNYRVYPSVMHEINPKIASNTFQAKQAIEAAQVPKMATVWCICGAG